jgi:hypothetical protein
MRPNSCRRSFPCAVDEDQCGRAPHPVAVHGCWDRRARYRDIHAHRMGHTVFMQKSFERHRRHRRVVLENSMQADDRHAVFSIFLMHPFRLRHGVAYAARTQHLEGVQQNHSPRSCDSSSGARVFNQTSTCHSGAIGA